MNHDFLLSRGLRVVHYPRYIRAGPIQYIWRVATHDSNWQISTKSITLIRFNFLIESTGCLTVSVPTLIAYNSVIC